MSIPKHKGRWFCPSCHQKNVQTTARFILDHVLAPVPHRHYVLAIPKLLRPYFQRHRRLLKELCALAYDSLTEYLRTALDCPKGVPGIILTLHTFGDYLDFHPHIHALVADGLFLRDPPDAPPPPAPTPASDPQPPNGPTFLPLPETPLKPLEELFRAKVIHLLVAEKLLPPERVQMLYSWKHSGFNLHAGEPVPPENKADLEDLAQYILRFIAVPVPGLLTWHVGESRRRLRVHLHQIGSPPASRAWSGTLIPLIGQ